MDQDLLEESNELLAQPSNHGDLEALLFASWSAMLSHAVLHAVYQFRYDPVLFGRAKSRRALIRVILHRGIDGLKHRAQQRPARELIRAVNELTHERESRCGLAPAPPPTEDRKREGTTHQPVLSRLEPRLITKATRRPQIAQAFRLILKIALQLL